MMAMSDHITVWEIVKALDHERQIVRFGLAVTFPHGTPLPFCVFAHGGLAPLLSAAGFPSVGPVPRFSNSQDPEYPRSARLVIDREGLSGKSSLVR